MGGLSTDKLQGLSYGLHPRRLRACDEVNILSQLPRLCSYKCSCLQAMHTPPMSCWVGHVCRDPV